MQTRLTFDPDTNKQLNIMILLVLQDSLWTVPSCTHMCSWPAPSPWPYQLCTSCSPFTGWTPVVQLKKILQLNLQSVSPQTVNTAVCLQMETRPINHHQKQKTPPAYETWISGYLIVTRMCALELYHFTVWSECQTLVVLIECGCIFSVHFSYGDFKNMYIS